MLIEVQTFLSTVFVSLHRHKKSFVNLSAGGKPRKCSSPFSSPRLPACLVCLLRTLTIRFLNFLLMPRSYSPAPSSSTSSGKSYAEMELLRNASATSGGSCTACVTHSAASSTVSIDPSRLIQELLHLFAFEIQRRAG